MAGRSGKGIGSRRLEGAGGRESGFRSQSRSSTRSASVTILKGMEAIDRLTKTVSLHTTNERVAMDAQNSRRLRLVPLGFLQGGHDGTTLCFIETHGRS